MSNPKVVFEAVPSRWVIEYQNPGQDWEFIERKPTLEAAKEYAQQSMDYASADSASLWRVVDTRPDEAQPDEAQPDTVHAGDETPLTLDQYQQQAKATAVYPEDKAREYLVAGLAGEVGEVASLFAKHWRADQEWLDYSEVAPNSGMYSGSLLCSLTRLATTCPKSRKAISTNSQTVPYAANSKAGRSQPRQRAW